jgi:hypothetical protein
MEAGMSIADGVMEADFRLENHGSVWLVRPLNGEAQEWLEEHTDGMWFGNALAVEPRYVDGLVFGLESDGFAFE